MGIYKETFEPLTTYLSAQYGDKVEKIDISTRIENSPSILVTSQFGYSANMERIMKSQAFADSGKSQYLISKKTMEINPRHPLVIELNSLVEDSPDEQKTIDVAWMLYDTALSSSGFQIEEVEEFSARMMRMMAQAINVESLELAPEVEVPADDEDDEDDLDEDEDDLDEEDVDGKGDEL